MNRLRLEGSFRVLGHCVRLCHFILINLPLIDILRAISLVFSAIFRKRFNDDRDCKKRLAMTARHGHAQPHACQHGKDATGKA